MLGQVLLRCSRCIFGGCASGLNSVGQRDQRSIWFFHLAGLQVEGYPNIISLCDSSVKVKQSRYTPWRRLGGEEV
jgi:hypothetical protein